MSPNRPDSRRNSESSYRRNSEFIHIKPLIINRRSSDISIRTLDRSPTHFQSIVPIKTEVQEKSESDSDHPDCSEKAALMNEKSKSKDEEPKVRKKNLSWNDKNIEDPEDITPETNLLPENTSGEARVMVHNTNIIKLKLNSENADASKIRLGFSNDVLLYILELLCRLGTV